MNLKILLILSLSIFGCATYKAESGKRFPANIGYEFDISMAKLDNCYKLSKGYDDSYPTICLSGTMEEGINGANVRLAKFSAQYDVHIIGCAKSSRSNLTENNSTYEFIVNDSVMFGLKNVSLDLKGNPKKGQAILGSFLKGRKPLELEFTVVDPARNEKLQKAMSENEACNNLNSNQERMIP